MMDGVALTPEQMTDDDAYITFLLSEVARLQSRVSQLGVELADAQSWQNTHRPKTMPKGRT